MSGKTEEKKAVTSGYWQLLRYDPRLKAEGKNPFSLDSKDPTTPYGEFLRGEVRYSALEKQDPDKAARLFEKSENDAMDRIDYLKKLAQI